MPQLDFVIIFPQIFWLCFLFLSFYYLLTFYLLPSFLLALKLRKLLVEENTKNSILTSTFLSAHKLRSKDNLNKNLFLLSKNFQDLEKRLCTFNILCESKIDFKFRRSTVHTLLFCDTIIFKSILLYPKLYLGKQI